MKKYSKIALIMAMEEEARPIITHFNLQKVDKHPIFERFATKDQSLVLSLNGTSKKHKIDRIGTQAATLNTYATIQDYAPDLVISCGTAGGFKAKGGAIGDVYLAHKKVCFHDRRINLDGGFREYALGNYKVENLDQVAEKLGLKLGIISSGDALDYTNTDWEIMQKNQAKAKEMEAAAVAWVCQLHQTPFTALKAITDIVDGAHPTEKEFLLNLEHATLQLKEKLRLILDNILAK